MHAHDVMTSDPICCSPEASAREAAALMAEHDCGCLPVVERHSPAELVGVVTDRDLALRGLGKGHGPETRVSDLMTTRTSCCSPESDLEEVEQIMAEGQVRRVPVVDEDGCCVGIVSQADLARARREVGGEDVASVVERISEPTERASRVEETRPGRILG